jgi:hypothetical protein
VGGEVESRRAPDPVPRPDDEHHAAPEGP